MPYRVFEVRRRDASRLEAALRLEPVSRQSVTVKEARSLGLDRDTLFVHLAGEESALELAATHILKFGRRTPYAASIHDAIQREAEDASGGLGFVFED